MHFYLRRNYKNKTVRTREITINLNFNYLFQDSNIYLGFL